MERKKLVKCVVNPLSGTSTAEDTETAVEHDIMNEDWKIRDGSIWNVGQERTPGTRVKSRATTCQLVQLVKFMEQHKELAVSHSHPMPETEELWGELTRLINQFGPPKTTKQCKTTWRDLRKRAFILMRSRNKDKGSGRNLYGMAPKIVSIIAAAGGLPKGAIRTKRFNLIDPPPPESEQSSQSSSGAQSQTQAEAEASPEVPIVDPVSDQPGPGLRVEKSSSGNQLVIRVSDKNDSKTNVFNRFSVSDGYFENNIIVKEEQEDHQHENEESSEQMEAEEEPKEFSAGEEMFPAVQAVLGEQESGSEDRSKALKELNDTLRKFVSQYSERTQALRERTALERERISLDREKLALDRARLQYEMDTFKNKNGSAPKSDS